MLEANGSIDAGAATERERLLGHGGAVVAMGAQANPARLEAIAEALLRRGIAAIWLHQTRLPGADPFAVTCALDWLLYDWLMAHRDGPDSAEIVFPKGYEDAAALVVSAAAASVAARSTFDPGLLLTVRGGAVG